MNLSEILALLSVICVFCFAWYVATEYNLIFLVLTLFFALGHGLTLEDEESTYPNEKNPF